MNVSNATKPCIISNSFDTIKLWKAVENIWNIFMYAKVNIIPAEDLMTCATAYINSIANTDRVTSGTPRVELGRSSAFVVYNLASCEIPVMHSSKRFQILSLFVELDNPFVKQQWSAQQNSITYPVALHISWESLQPNSNSYCFSMERTHEVTRYECRCMGEL